MNIEKPPPEESGPEKLEIKEYGAEAGIAKAISEIERLAESQRYVLIAISGSSIDVGKTYVSSRVERGLMERDISFESVSSLSTFSTKPVFEKRRDKKGRVLVFEAEGPIFGPAEEGKKNQDEWLRKKIKEKKLGLPVSKIDIRVYVYRPDKPFSPDVDLRSADIVIRNEGAVDDTRKDRKSAVKTWRLD